MSAARQRQDYLAALSTARDLDRVDPDRVALWGFSLGTGHVQALAASGGAGIAALVLVAPLVSGVASLGHIGGAMHPVRLFGAGLRDAARAARGAGPYRVAAVGPAGSTAVLNSPDSEPGIAAITGSESSWANEACARAALAPPYMLFRKVRRIARPALYCVFEDDDINPPKLAVRAAERAPRGELRTYPGGHFAFARGEVLDRVVEDQVEFLRRALA
jgi:pimeloyl-ACP methyl ester carboxylesterase